MKSFNAAVLKVSKQPLQILELLPPKRLEEGQVFIKVRKAALCGSQLGEINAVKGLDKYLPHVLGHEAVADVVEVGPNVQHFQKGDLVIAHWMKNEHPDGQPISYQDTNNATVNSGHIAIFSEFAVVSQNRLTKITSSLDNSMLAVIGCGFLTSYGVIKRDLKISYQSKGNLLVLGFGGIGQIISSLLVKLSDLEITILDTNELNRVKGKKLGIKEIYSNIDEVATSKYDFIIDTTGNTSVIEKSYKLLTKTGILCLVGVTPVGERIEIDPMPLHYGQQIIGSFGGQAIPDEDIPEILKIIEKDEDWFRQMIGESYDLLEINEAIELLKSGKNSGRILITFGM
jgi:D-arabinose 1-dehydrogenase-like Zn-dependent alcohol dehydrogenase